MTSDTKIGLLLGLIFIFVIAFLIQGLPGFRQGRSSNELTYNLMGARLDASTLAARERTAQRRYMEPIPYVEQPVDVGMDMRVRSSEPLPATPSPVSDYANQVVQEVQSQKAEEMMNPNLLQRQQALRREAWPRTYVVQEGDNLAVIAKHFYGAQEGNREAAVQRIFAANRNQLASPDSLQIGQRLIIPAVPGQALQAVTDPVTGMRPVEPTKRRSADGHWYVVSDGDSLWDIAAAKLGDGKRYPEIVRLNASVLSDENSLKPGMRLRLP